MRLVPNWKKSYKWLSVQIHVLQGAVAATWLYLPPDLRGFIPPHAMAVTATVIAGLGVVGRIIDQSKPDVQATASDAKQGAP